jgi:hypothetical protein
MATYRRRQSSRTDRKAIMTTPTVTDLPRHLEPTTADPFLDPGPQGGAVSVMRELDRRASDGIDVRLLWNQTDNRILVAVVDAKTGDAFEIEVEAGESLAAFHHPYAYAAFRRVSRTDRLIP